ncbi:exodeoxyribonuclease V subunit beta [Halothiobacillus sp. DCM-1]|uniref:exodeoxyribonuclease V subunit beta n=1 Tax=Halothiobacillus sp. DCM-1 TaxID=3112558 RepID=UPI003255D62B
MRADAVPELDPLRFPFEGCQLIEASAGTGKTFTIALLYVRAILGHGIAPLIPRDILVTTFTELAADELKSRIRARLVQAARYFSGEETPNDTAMADLLAAYPPEDRPAQVNRLAAAANQMDDAAIHTIHAWCQRMLQEHAFLSGQPFTLSIQPDLQPWFDWAAQDYWRAQVYWLPEPQAALAAELLESPAKLIERLRAVIQHENESILSPDEPAEMAHWLDELLAIRQAAALAEQSAKACWQQERASVVAAFDAVVEQLHGTTHRGMREDIRAGRWQAVDDWAAGMAPLPANWVKLFSGPAMKQRATPPDTPFQQRLRDWQASTEASERAKTASQTALLIHAAHWMRQRMAELKRQARVASFDDLLIALDRALAGEWGERLAHTIADRYPLAMIDEFQDTDGLQLALFDRIFRITDAAASTKPALVLIGDPKQSIYRFRYADLASYLRARHAARQIHTLKDNYRSTPRLITAVNHLFDTAIAQNPDLFGEGSGIPFIPVMAKGTPPHLARWDAATQAWVTPPPMQLLAKAYAAPEDLTSTKEFIEELAQATARQIADWLVAAQVGQAGWLAADGGALLRPLAPQDVAILVADRHEAQAMRRALQAVGVASVYRSDRRQLFQTAQARDFWHWLNAMAEPNRPGFLKIALATASFARRLDELEALRDESAFAALIEAFVRYRELWQRQGILAAVYQLLHDFDIPARLLSAESGEDGGARRLTNLLHLADWAQAAQANRPGIESLRHGYAVALTSGETEQELQLDQDAALVQIMTIHASKGLQFPLVFLPFLPKLGLPRANMSGGRSALRLADQGWLLSPDQAALATEQRAQLDDAVRQAYVALTRAESACVLGVGLLRVGTAKAVNRSQSALGRILGLVDGCPKENPQVLARYDEVLARLYGVEGISLSWLTAPLPAVRFTPASSPALAPARSAVARARSRWRIASYSQLVDAAGNQAPETPQENRIRELEETGALWPALPADAPPLTHPLSLALQNLPRGAAFGTQMHAVLEAAGRQGFARIAGDPSARAALLDRVLPDHALAGALGSTPRLWADWLQAILDTPLQIDPPVSLGRLSHYRLELEFWLPVDALDVAQFDAWVTAAVFPGEPRPALTSDQLQGVLKGFIDLVFEADGRYFVLDYKSNVLPEYGSAQCTAAMLEHRYDVQLVIYLAALHRHLADRLPDYAPARHLGGAVYWFTRGVAEEGAGQCLVPPPLALLNALDPCWDGQRLEAVS